MIVFIAVLISAILRFFALGTLTSPTWDEVAWGYNAYSLGLDGKDEFGRLFPITFLESFGDFKPPVYAYLSILPIKLFGLNEFATRFASAFFGTLTVLITYFLAKKIFPNSPRIKINKFYIDIPVVATIILAISPWHILLSRAAFEANVATFFIVLGVYLFLASLDKNKWLFILSITSFTISMYTFNTARIIVPLLLAVLLIGKFRKVLLMKKEAAVGFLLGFILLFPLFLFLMTPQAKLRYNEVNIFSDVKVVDRANAAIEYDKKSLFSRIIHNRRVLYSLEYLKHYFDNLNPLFLFIKGDGNPKFSIQDVGEMYIWEIPFFIGGYFLLFRKREGNWWIIPYWMIISIIPAATARETPHALRIESALPTFQIISAVGIYHFLSKLSNLNYKIASLKIKFIAIVALILVVGYNFLYFWNNLVFHYPKEFSREWQYGYKDAVLYAQSVENEYDSIHFTEALGRPYIYVLFYTKYDPKIFRKEAIIDREALGFVHVRKFSKFTFLDDVKKETFVYNKILYVDTPNNIPGNAITKKKIYLRNGNVALVAYTL